MHLRKLDKMAWKIGFLLFSYKMFMAVYRIEAL